MFQQIGSGSIAEQMCKVVIANSWLRGSVHSLTLCSRQVSCRVSLWHSRACRGQQEAGQ